MASDEIYLLHVDDEQDHADLTATFLERQDDRFSVETATSASVGLDRLAENDYDCIVSDYDMPGQNGIEFLDTLREENPNLPFILYTGKGSEEVASDALSAGATDYLKKDRGSNQYELLANRIQNAVEQYRTHQRAVELERIRTLANDINQALVRANSLSAAETQVCKLVSDTEPYLFAWIGRTEDDTERIAPRAWAGIEDGFLDAITLTADDTATGRGPGGTAIRERRVAVSQNIHEDPKSEPWREDALERGYQAVGAVPLEHNNTLYGVLLVYADRLNAFDEDERALLGELGRDIGHAIYSFEMQRNIERFKHAVDHAGHAVFVTATDGTIEYVNPAFETITGYSAEEAIGRNPRIFKSGEMADAYYEALWESLLDGNVWEEEVINRRQDGELYYANQTIAPIFGENETIEGFVAVQEDVTDRKEWEETLERRTQAIEQAPVGISISDPNQADNPLIYVNDAFVDLMGCPREDILGENCRFLQGEHSDPDTVARIREAIDAEEPVSVDIRNYRKDGSDFWNHLEISPVRNDEGEVSNYVGYQMDITERKQKQQELTRQNERLDQFTRVVSHDLRNPLNVAVGRLELAQDECNSAYLDHVARAHERMEILIDDLLTLARTGNQIDETQAIDLGDVIEDCWRTVETDNAILVTETNHMIQADRNRLQQLLENLIRNAVEYAGTEARITVGDLDDGVGFYVSDDGPGIPCAERKDVFDAGYSTTDQSTGFGLNIVQEIAHAHGWDITVSDSETGGARFEMAGVAIVDE